MGAATTRLAADGATTESDDLDVAFEVAGEDAAVDDAIQAVRPGGRVVLVGIPGGERTSFVAEVARRKELAMRLCRRMRADDLSRALALLVDGLAPLDLVTARHPLGEAATAFGTLAARDGLKVVIHPTGAGD
jgi:L-iditol 2-dehydrogenase